MGCRIMKGITKRCTVRLHLTISNPTANSVDLVGVLILGESLTNLMLIKSIIEKFPLKY